MLNITKRAGEGGDTSKFVPPKFMMNPENVEYMGRAQNKPLKYYWSGALVFEADGSKYKRCLSYFGGDEDDDDENYHPPVHAPCECNSPNEENGGCDSSTINHPEPNFRWMFDGNIRMYKRETRLISFWSGDIRHQGSGKCLVYAPMSNFPLNEGKDTETPGRLGDLDMVKCPTPESEDLQRAAWTVWLTENDAQTSIIPSGGTHHWPACEGTPIQVKNEIASKLSAFKKNKVQVQWKSLHRGLTFNETTGDVYFGCVPEEKTRITPHPWFYKVPRAYGFYPDKNDIEDTRAAVNGQRGSLSRLVDFDYEVSIPGNEVPVDLEVKELPAEEVKEALKGLQYDPPADVHYQGGETPPYDGVESEVEREQKEGPKELETLKQGFLKMRNKFKSFGF
ncbi:hypothetical protein TWF281_007244 [Arthrobotrys megalospora]